LCGKRGGGQESDNEDECASRPEASWQKHKEMLTARFFEAELETEVWRASAVPANVGSIAAPPVEGKS
jgi:hypothetical protein